MKHILFLSLIIFNVSVALADLKVEMGSTAPNSTNILVSFVDRIKGNKVREDAFFEGANIGSKILNLDTGKGFKLMPDKKWR